MACILDMMRVRQLSGLGTGGAPLKYFKADKVQAQYKPNSSVVIDPPQQHVVVHTHMHKPPLKEYLFRKHRDKKLSKFLTIKLELFY